MSEELQVFNDPYNFQARVPFDHGVNLVKLVRAGDPPPGEIMILAGAIVGEIGALRRSGFSFTQSDAESAAVEAMTIDGAMESIEQVIMVKDATDPTFDPTPYLPILLKIALWFLERWANK